MARYDVAVATGAAAAGAVIADLRTAASDRAFLREIGIFSAAATQANIGLIRPSAVGTASTTAAGQPTDPGDPAGTGVIGTAWSSAPTIAGTPIYLRRVILPAAIGAGVILQFMDPLERGLTVPVSSSLLLWNFGAAANPILHVYMTWEE